MPHPNRSSLTTPPESSSSLAGQIYLHLPSISVLWFSSFAVLSTRSNRLTAFTFLSLFSLFLSPIALTSAQFSWQKLDTLDKVQQQIDSVSKENCKVVDVNKLFLQSGAVSHVPDLQWIGINPVFPNRTNLLQVHNMALSRAFFLRLVHLFKTVLKQTINQN